MQGLASPCGSHKSAAFCRSLPPSLREAAGRPICAMSRVRISASASPVQASATETAMQRTWCRDGAPLTR